MSKKIIAFALAAVFAFGMIAPANADTAADLQAQIASLLAQIQQLQQQLTAAQGGAATTTGLCLSANLKKGMKGDAVKTLQEGLKQDPSVYPEGLTTGYFGPLTKAAVIRFQEKYASDILAPWGLTKGTGFVGSTTRAKFNALYCNPVVTEPTTTPPTTVEGLPEGCTSTEGYSPITGESCSATTTTTVLPEGCTSTEGFSPTTGEPCSGTTTTTVAPSEGSIQVTTAGAYVDTSLNWGETNKPILAFDVKALNSPMTVKRIDVQFYYDGSHSIFPWKTFKSFSLYSDDTEIATLTPVKADYIETTYGQDYTLRLSGLNDVIAKDATKTYVLKANVLDNPTNTNNYTIRLATDSSAIRATDSAGLNQYGGGTSLTNTVTIANVVTTATLTASLNADNPAEGNIIGDANSVVSNQELLRFNLKGTGDATTLKTLTVAITNPTYASAIKLYDGSTLLSSKASTSSVTFSNLNVDIAKDATKTLSIKADIQPIDGSTVAEGSTIAATLTANGTNIVAADSQDNTATVSSAIITGKTMHLYTVAPSFSFISGKITPDPNSSTKATAEIEFSVTANGGDIYIDKNTNNATAGIDANVYGETAATGTLQVDTSAKEGTDAYVIYSGQTKNFTVSNVLTASGGGLSGLKITQIHWGNEDSTASSSLYTTDYGFEDYKSGLTNIY